MRITVSKRQLQALQKRANKEAKIRLTTLKRSIATTVANVAMDNTPMWSGRTVESARILSRAKGPRDDAIKFRQKSGKLPIRQEARRDQAEKGLFSSLDSMKFSEVVSFAFTMDSLALDAGLGEGKAPTAERARNKGVVIEDVVLMAVKRLEGVV